MFKDIIYTIISWIIGAIIKLVAFILGLVIVPFGLLFLKDVDESTRRSYSDKRQKPGEWVHIGLKGKLFWLWENDRDGYAGDMRGWWNTNARFDGGAYAFWNLFWWGAVRNPSNNLRFVPGLTCDVSQSTVEMLAGTNPYTDDKLAQTGWCFLRAKGKYFNYYEFRYTGKPNKNNKAPLYIRMGHKIKITHNDIDWSLPQYQKGAEDYTKRFKGFTIRLRFFQELD